RRHMPKGNITVTHIKRELGPPKDAMQRAVLDRFALTKSLKLEKKREKDAGKPPKQTSEQQPSTEEEGRRKRVYVLDFDGDMEASELDGLRQEITAVLAMAEPSDEVILRLESPGGMVHAYGLASAQLLRF